MKQFLTKLFLITLFCVIYSRKADAVFNISQHLAQLNINLKNFTRDRLSIDRRNESFVAPIGNHTSQDLVSKLHHTVFNQPPDHGEIISGLLIPGPVTDYISQLHYIWKDFTEAHEKVYTRAMELRRKRQWLENLLRVHHHNEEARLGRHSYFLRANHLSDLNIREYMRRMVRLANSDRSFTRAVSIPTHKKRDVIIPEEWNWVEQGFFTPAWDQGYCGSCYAFSVAASAEGQYFRKTRSLHPLSVQQIVDCSVFMGNWGCHGGSLRNALRYLLRARGLASEEEYPYRAKRQLCHFFPWHKKVNVTSYVILPENDEEAIEYAVATSGPVACSLDASPYTFQLYQYGVEHGDKENAKNKGSVWSMTRGDSGGKQTAIVNGAMPFIDLSLPERDRFLRSTQECHIPGYTGHCPTLKFRFGKGFGTDTRNIIRKMKDRSLTLGMKPYKEGDPELSVLKETQREKGEEQDPSILTNLPSRPYILGYTGFIPGLNFRYGSSFVTAANESVKEFSLRLLQEKANRERDRFQIANATPKMTTVRNRDEVNRLLHNYSNRTSKKQGSNISFELPPIAGYTGHIPRLLGSEASLSQGYHTAVKAGLARLEEERQRRHHKDMAKEAVKNAIACTHSRE